MKISQLISLTAGAALAATLPAHAGLVVTQNNNATTLVNTILGSGVYSTGSASTTGAADAFGTFTGGVSAGIGIESGIIISTGNVIDAVGPNNSTQTSTDFPPTGVAGDSATLEFNFRFDNVAGGNLFFNFVFASDEYTEYSNSAYNDGFNLLVNGVNVALIPGTSLPVSINEVNQVDNTSYFVNNTTNIHDIEFDGFTTPITAFRLNLAGGVDHNIKFNIFDVGDGIYDSAIFLQAAAFGNTPVDTNPVPEPATVGLFGFLALGAYLLRRRAVAKVA